MTVEEQFFAEPFFCLDGGSLYAAYAKHFFLTVRFVPAQTQLLASVEQSGRAGLEWVLDFDGKFFELRSLGLVPKTVPQKLGLTRQKERFQIEQPRTITVGDFKVRIAEIQDRFEEAPVAQATREALNDFPDDLVIDRGIMIKLMGG